MGRQWRIMRAAVEQEILFPSRKVYEAYILGLKRKEDPYEVVKETEDPCGTMTVLMRKSYNFCEFLESIPHDEGMFRKYLVHMMASYVDNKFGADKEYQVPEIKKDICDLTGMTEDEVGSLMEEAGCIIWPEK